MSDRDRLDLSSLDPMTDPIRWRHVVDDTLARVDRVLRDRALRDDPISLIASWRRPLLIAAAAALAILIPAEIALELQEDRAERIQRLVAISTRAAADARPTGADFLQALAAEPLP